MTAEGSFGLILVISTVVEMSFWPEPYYFYGGRVVVLA
jgi:hypothetical protein